MTDAQIRPATAEDVAAIVDLLADDPLGSGRESPDRPDCYIEAFYEIDESPGATILVAEIDGRIVACLQINLARHLTYRGGRRATVEGVRVAADRRSSGLGKRMLEAAIEHARAADCHVVQLTTDKQRQKALRFYESLGFVPSHEGMKLHLE